MHTGPYVKGLRSLLIFNPFRRPTTICTSIFGVYIIGIGADADEEINPWIRD
jgi:hypothetical protein